MALLEQVKQLIPRLTYQQIQDNPFAEGATADVSEDAQDIVPLVIDAIVGFCHTQLCDFTSAFPHGTRMMKGAIEVMRIGLQSRADPNGIAQVSGRVLTLHDCTQTRQVLLVDMRQSFALHGRSAARTIID